MLPGHQEITKLFIELYKYHKIMFRISLGNNLAEVPYDMLISVV